MAATAAAPAATTTTTPVDLQSLAATLRKTKDELRHNLKAYEDARQEYVKAEDALHKVEAERTVAAAEYRELLDQFPKSPDTLVKRLEEVNLELEGLREVMMDSQRLKIREFQTTPPDVAKRVGGSDGYHAAGNAVSAVPDVYATTVPRNSVLVLACDGVWDMMSSDTAARHVSRQVRHRDPNPARSLIERAHALDSQDNLTAIVVRFE